MAHIHTEPGQHDTTVSAYIVRLDKPTPTLILHRHKKLHKYLPFGGHIELDENPWKAIAHELAEESGYSIQQVKILQPGTRLTKLSDATIHPYPITLFTIKFGDLEHYHTDITYAFVTHEPPVGIIGEGESEDIRAFTAEELVNLPSQDIPENVKEVGLFVLEECLKNWTEVDTLELVS